MTTNENPGSREGQGGWQPTPQGGEYDAEATAFVQLPPEDFMDAPLAAPGHGYVPPVIMPLTPAPGGPTGNWGQPPATQQDTGAVHWPEPQSTGWQHPEEHPQQPHGPQQPAPGQGQSFDDAYVTGQWNFGEAAGSGDGAEGGSSSELTGQWAIPVAEGDLQDDSGEFSTALLASPWNGGAPPATLPGGATAPWATPPEPAQATPEEPGPQDGGTGHAPHYPAEERSAEPAAADGRDPRRAQNRAVRGSGFTAGQEFSAGAAGTPGPAQADPGAEAGFPHGPQHSQLPGAAYGQEPTGQEAHGHAPAAPDSGTPVPDSAYRPGSPHEHEEAHPSGSDAGPGAASGYVEAPFEEAPFDDAPFDDAPFDDAPFDDAPGAAGGTPESADQDAAPESLPESLPEAEPEPLSSSNDSAEHPADSYVLRVNGADRPVTDAWIGESLLYVLRERLGLAGAKDGCSQGECGACNVQVDGRLVASCLVPAATAAGSEVRTVEGLAVDGEPSDVQRALANCGAVQCGFCIPGMAMTVHDLLEGNHAPTELETRQALCGNLCRCSGYRGVLDAVSEVAAERAASAEAAAAASEDARVPHQAPPGAGSTQPSHSHDGGMA